jgi:hypothetical protein
LNRTGRINITMPSPSRRKSGSLVLSEVQHARVPQLPVIPRESVDGHAEETVIMAVDPELAA